MRTFILGTDWWTDCDDAVALRLLLRSVKAGKIRLAGIGINACMEHSVTSMDGFLAKEGVNDIPIGIDLAATDYGGNKKYQAGLAPYATRYRCNEDAEDAVRLYRRILAEAEEKVDILEIGFLNVIAGALESGPDDISPRTGMELFAEKVRMIWSMAGKWDEPGGKEYNFCCTPRTSRPAAVLCDKCPVPITFLGWEIGHDVISGTGLQDDVLYQVMKDHGSQNGRSSWDPMTALLAVTGDAAEAGYSLVRGKATVDPETGANWFAEDPDGLHCYVVRNYEPAWYADKINAIVR